MQVKKAPMRIAHSAAFMSSITETMMI